MAGYREHSFDPMAYPRYGRPLRPFNWVQWTGVACDVIGIGIYLAYFAGKAGWIPQKLANPTIALPFIMLAIPLINSRREEVPDPAPELAQQRRKVLLITVLVCSIILGAAVAFEIARS